MEYLECSPAYGRDHKSKKEVQEAWDSGKDFRIESMGPHEGRYVNKDSFKVEDKGKYTLNLRYKKLTMVHVVKV